MVISPGHAHRTLLCVRRLFGDESDLQFWTVAAHYLQMFAQARQLSVPDAEGQPPAEGPPSAASPASHLDICHDTLCESTFFQVRETRGQRTRRPPQGIN